MKFSKFTEFQDFGLKILHRTLVFEASGASGENVHIFMIFSARDATFAHFGPKKVVLEQ